VTSINGMNMWPVIDLMRFNHQNTKRVLVGQINLEGESLMKILIDVAPCGACRPWIFFINGVLCFLKINGSGMEKEER